MGAEDVKRGLQAERIGTIIGAIFNAFPYVSHSQDIGLVGVTDVYSPWVYATGGGVMLALGLPRKLAFVVASAPNGLVADVTALISRRSELKLCGASSQTPAPSHE